MGVRPRAQRATKAVALFFASVSLFLPLFLFFGHSWSHEKDLASSKPEVLRQRGIPELLEDLVPTTNHSLERRALSFTDAANKGRELSCLLAMTDIADVQSYLDANKPGRQATSQWVNYNSLAANGWELNTQQNEPGFELDDYTSIFGVSASDATYQQWVQRVAVNFGGVDYPPSGGKYGNLYSTKGGLIAADENYSPATMSPELTRYVPMSQWSDVVFLAWQKLCSDAGVSVGSLSKMFRISVSGSDSINVITQAVSQVGGSMTAGYSSKVRFLAGSSGFYGILGTVNGFGQAWFLLQHRAQMGHLTIKAISYFMEPESDDKCLMFEIGPYTEESDTSS